jgi:superfamily II DNA or RNA helicase
MGRPEDLERGISHTAFNDPQKSGLDMHIILPDVLIIDELRADNPVRQIGEPSKPVDGSLVTFARGRLRGFLFRAADGHDVLIIPKTRQIPDGHPRVLQATIDPAAEVADLSDGIWLRHPLLDHGNNVERESEIAQILASWVDGFSYVREEPDREIIGLRGPQLGAVHASHAHWSGSNATATIVMPTGTGKTETMLSILVSANCSKLLVVVPTDALRAQLANKFLTLGILKAPGSRILRSEARYPIVCSLRHIPTSTDEVDEIFEHSMVIVTTSSIAGQCTGTVQERMANHCPYLFIDEAHHAEAPTWSAFKSKFKRRRILQFTATPFREDGRPLDGEIIFKYPLKRAQEEGYFQPIQFSPVVEFNRKRADEVIAKKAIEQLRADSDKGHILMARVESVARAGSVFDLYSQYPEFNPVQLHTGIKSLRQRETIRRQIITGESRIVVCVDMLGEGFDLPELKIAAFHDIRKTLAVTLQLAGRFTRARPDLGHATFIANTADINVQDELRKLYTRDPDWNVLLPQLSDSMIGEQVSLQEFLKGFTEFTQEIPLKSVRPAMSTVVYTTKCEDWTPDNFRTGIPGLNSCEQVYHTTNHAEHTLIIVTARRVALAWTDVETLFSWQWELYVVIWSPEQNLLFINSSTNSGEYKGLAEAVARETATLVRGQNVFRSFAGVNRLRLQNVGLTEQLGRNVRYTGRMGSDVEQGLSEAQKHRARKSVLSGTGYEDGERVGVGASRKGRIWSHNRERVDQLSAWCKKIGAKILDDTIDPDQVLKGTLDSSTVLARPNAMPIAVDWPEEIYTTPEALWTVCLGDHDIPLSELSLEIVSPSQTGPLRFAIASESERIELELELFQSDDVLDYRYAIRGEARVEVRRGERTDPESAADFFYENPPVIWFSNGGSLEGNQYVELKGTRPPYDVSKIQAWDWSGVDIRKESQGDGKEPDSIQAKLIRELLTRDYDMIVDDDRKGEAADVVAIRVCGDVATPSSIEVEFFHCKYSQQDEPGRRIGDLYEVCGQAQKSVSWMSSHQKRTDLFTHLLRRETHQRDLGAPSRFELGDGELLQTIREMSQVCPVSLKINIVQPGVSKAKVSREQLELMSVTENYLRETYQLGFGVIASP